MNVKQRMELKLEAVLLKVIHKTPLNILK